MVPSRSMPVTTDSLVLADFVEPLPGQRILDLGTGSGIIALSLAARAEVTVVGIDNSFEALEEAQQALERDRALLQGQVEFFPGDLRNLEYLAELGPFDQVVCNPPYFKLDEARLPPSEPRAAARHEISCTLEEVVRAAAQVMPMQGVFSLVQIPARLGEVLQLLPAYGLALQVIQPVYTARDRDARLVLFRAMKGRNGTLRMLPPLHPRALNGI